jgi:hypothetical protein
MEETVPSDADEIRKIVAELRETGEYDRLSSPQADKEAAFIGRALGQTVELSDDDVEQLMASLESRKSSGAGWTRAEIERAVARYRPATGPSGSTLSGPPLPDPTHDPSLGVTESERRPDKT